MSDTFNKWLNNPSYFRYGFIILMCLGIILNGFILENENNFYILYIFSTIFLGIGFYNNSTSFIVFLTLFVVICRFFLIPEPSLNVETFITYLLDLSFNIVYLSCFNEECSKNQRRQFRISNNPS